LFDKIAQYKDSIEGVTILGGEPLDQYDETLLLLQLCVKAGLSTMLFTGYDIQEITEKRMEQITKKLDILITGRYEEQNRTVRHQWIGSTNQEIHFLSDRYKRHSLKNMNYTEVSIDEDGSITVLGFPDESIALFNLDIAD
jgi:anaerobic ribonucleoside-triphosphate reductase activating protein